MILKNILLEDILKQFIKKGYVNEKRDIIIMTVDEHNVEKSKKTSYEKLAKKDSDVLYYPLLYVDVLFNYEPSDDGYTKIVAGRRMLTFITDEYKTRIDVLPMLKATLHSKRVVSNYIFYFYIRKFDIGFTKSYICRQSFLNYKLFECLRDMGNTCINLDAYKACSEYISKHKKEICEKYNIFIGLTPEDIFKETLGMLLGYVGIRVKSATGINLQNILIIEKL